MYLLVVIPVAIQTAIWDAIQASISAVIEVVIITVNRTIIIEMNQNQQKINWISINYIFLFLSFLNF